MEHSPVVRLNPTQYAHILDKNLNVTRLISGPLTYVRHDHETLVRGPEEMVLVKPRFYCKVKNPALIKDGKPTLDRNQQIVLAHGEEEIRLSGPPFPLYPGEELLEISPLRVVPAQHALRLEAARDFTDESGIKRIAGDVWQFLGPATYVPRVEVKILAEIAATIVEKGSALRLSAKQHLIDCDGVERQAGEEWLMRHDGAYLPNVHEIIEAEIEPLVLTLTTAIHLRALRTFTDGAGVQRLAGEEWVLTRADCSDYLLGVDEEVLNHSLPLTVLARNQYCVVVNAWRDGKPVSGRKELRRGERMFFLQPGEELEGNRVKNVVVLVEDEALLLRATEPFTDLGEVDRTPGDRWCVLGPCEYVPPVEVEVVKRYKSIPLDENEGIYIRNIKTGRVEMIVGKSYLLKADEELWEKELDPTVEKLLQTSRGYANSTKLDAMQADTRDKTRVVTFRTPHNTAVQVYDFRLKKSRIVWGPGLVMLGPDEEFTLVALSGDTPKKPQVLKVICLKLGPDFMSDVVVVETSDHARLSIKLSYNWIFDTKAQNDDKTSGLFNVHDFVGDCCMALASRVRGAVASKSFDDLHRNSSVILQEAIFGLDENGDLRASRRFKDNNLLVTGVDIQSVEPVDARTRDALSYSVQQAIQITTQAQEANARHAAERDEQEAKGMLHRERLRDEVEAEKAKQALFQLQAESSALLSMGKAKAEARARAEASQIEMEAKLKQAQLQIRAKQIKDQWDLQRQREGQELEITHQAAVNGMKVGLARDLTKIEIDRFRGQVNAIGKDTIKAMAQAGPELQAKLLGGLGLESVLITNGTSPINLFNTAHGLIGHKWDKAHKVAVTVAQAQRLESSGKLKDAEKLYLMVNEPDLAINMYKKNRHYEHMIRLVGQHRKDLLAETHLHLAQQLETESKFKDAERHYVEANDWKSAVNMYRAHDMWDDAIRVAKSHGGVNASKQVAYAWAVSLGGEAGAQLLTKFGLIEQAIDYATESGAFEQAFQLARTSMKTKLPEVHLKHAMFLEDEGRFKEAEEEFVNAKKPKEAIDMYVHQQDWKNALRIAENHDPGSRSDVLIAKGRALADKKDLKAAETQFVEGGKPELAVKAYKEQRMWDDAIRVAKTFEKQLGQGLLYELQQEKGRAMQAPDPGGDQDLMATGRMWEENGDYSKAIDAYLKVTQLDTRDLDYLEEVWEKAVELAMTHVKGRITEVIGEVSKRLMEIGRFEQAAEFLEGIDDHRAAAEVYMKGNMWEKARAAAKTDAQLAAHVEAQFKLSMQGGGGRGGGMGRRSSTEGPATIPVQGVGGGGGAGAGGGGAVGGVGDDLKELAQRGDWERCREQAEKRGQEGLEQYVILHGSALLKANDLETAVHVFNLYGTPLSASNISLYKQVAKELLGKGRAASTQESQWLPAVEECREVLFKLWAAMKGAAGQDANEIKEVERLLHVAHYESLHAVCKSKGGVYAEMQQRLATALIRYCDVLPADRVFYEAGQACKAAGKLNQAFVFTNRFLDICDAMEEAEGTSMIENTDFENTDVPFDFNIQDRTFLGEKERDEVRDWVLTLSVDNKVEPVLSTRACHKCNTQIFEGSLLCSSCNVRFKPCVVTGMPVGRGRGELAAEEVFVNFHSGAFNFKDYVEFTLKP